MAKVYFRRADRIGRLTRRTVPRFEVWRADGPPAEMTQAGLDRLLDARRYPADSWAAVQAADQALAAGDRSWIDAGTGRRVPEPPD